MGVFKSRRAAWPGPGPIEATGDAILHLPDTVSDVYPYLKWGLLAGVALFAYIELRKHT